MFRKFEAMGSSFLSLFVPSVQADAACGPWHWKPFTSCYECGGGPCEGWCASGCGCDHSKTQCQ